MVQSTESGVPESDTNSSPDSEARICSVRGCSYLLSHDAATKMCESCREKHRRYATTKRAKRKLEKAALGQALITIEQIPGSSLWLSESTRERSGSPGGRCKSTSATPAVRCVQPPILKPEGSTDAYSSPEISVSKRSPSITEPSPLVNPIQPPSTPLSLQGTRWNISNIDPRMFEAQPSSSELAGALTPLPRSTVPQQLPTSLSASPEATQVPTDAAQSAGESSSGSRRFCSIKGCKSILAGDYNYKMCSSCRDRYKNYGVTKRAKCKAERIAFDQELENLRCAEVERRAKEGLAPLSGEELRAWELSIIDEKVALPPTLANVLSSVASNAIASSPPYALSLSQILAPLDQLDSTQAAQLAHLMRRKLGSKTGGLSGEPVAGEGSMSEGAQLPEVQSSLTNPGGQNGAETDTCTCAGNEQGVSGSLPSALHTSRRLPQRMCTVSHCHTILPGHYLYKRCDRHRYQNRKHGKLKRVREKAIKVKGPDSVEEEEVIDTDAILKADSETFDSEAVEKKKIEMKARERAKQLILARNSPGVKRTKACELQVKADSNERDPKLEPNTVEGEDDVDETMKNSSVASAGIIEPRDCGSNHLVNEKRKAFSCTAPDCSNLINPRLRWRMCETCRTVRKELRLGQLELERHQEDDRGSTRGRDSGQVLENHEHLPPGTLFVDDLEGNKASLDETSGDSLKEPTELCNHRQNGLTFKTSTPRNIQSATQDQELIFGILHEVGSELRPSSKDVTPENEVVTGYRHSLPDPVLIYSPTIPQPTEFVYKGKDRLKRETTSLSSSTPSTAMGNSSDIGPTTADEPVRKRRRTKTPATVSDELLGQSTLSTPSSPHKNISLSDVSAPHGHIPQGGYYRYMPYPPPLARSYPYPLITSSAVPYPYPYAYGYPGFPYPSYSFGANSGPYPYAVPSSPQPPYPYTHTQPTPPAPVDRKGNSSPIDRTGGQQIGNGKSAIQVSRNEEDGTKAKVSGQRDTSTATKAAPPTSISNLPAKKFNFVSPMVANPVFLQSGSVPKRTCDVFTNYTPQTVQDGSVKKRRGTPLFQANAQDRLKQIQASLALSKPRDDSKGVFVTVADGEPLSTSNLSNAGGSKTRGSFRYMFYQPPATGDSESFSSGPAAPETTEPQPEALAAGHEQRDEEIPDTAPTEQSGTVGDQNEGDQQPTQAQAGSSRWCKNKACNRVISNNSSGWLCERCGAKIKHHQAKTKHRFKPEPVRKVTPKGSILRKYNGIRGAGAS